MTELYPLVYAVKMLYSKSNRPISLFSVKCQEVRKLNLTSRIVTVYASNVGTGAGGFEGSGEDDSQKIFVSPSDDASSEM